eukprot:CAMPEP_0179204466 /NCGR_PEP_ID=MMETSP0796-20121207/101928_1 /TAXON_ID=73915 /ORGANISM="Pyrodinium bahamense, Strain pbaha01" /LENGTH=46 /DNA_ID= /DNA_START= /DNA_END= /DNA_ORIENTATION=
MTPIAPAVSSIILSVPVPVAAECVSTSESTPYWAPPENGSISAFTS